MSKEDLLTFVIFSGLPGTGKSTLANQLARKLRWPLLRIDDVAGKAPEDADFRFWDEKILILLNIAEEQLKLGISVIVDSVFMGTDRIHAQEIANKQKALFRPLYCFVSDDKEWKKRVNKRAEEYPDIDVATWSQIQHQRQWFSKWEPNTALFVDAVEPIEENIIKTVDFISDTNLLLEPIHIKKTFVEG